MGSSYSFIDSDVEAYVLMKNAYFHYSSFLKEIEKDGIQNDGNCFLFNEIDKYLEDKDRRFKIELKKGKKLYRARIVSENDLNKESGIKVDEDEVGFNTTGFNEGNSREAPLGKSSVGRNNLEGVSYLYLANKISTACAEMKSNCGQIISVAEFEANRILRIVDFSKNVGFDIKESRDDNIALGTFFTLIMSRYFIPVNNVTEYLATQVITDHIRKSGVDGIAYRSFYDKNGINYTIFNSSRSSIKYNYSKLMMNKGVSNTFLDFNERRIVHTTSISGNKYNSSDADSICNRLKNQLG